MMFQPLFKIVSVFPDRIPLSADLFVESERSKNKWSFCENESIFLPYNITGHNDMKNNIFLETNPKLRLKDLHNELK